METMVYEIEFNDGRIFRVFCQNSAQKRKLIRSYKSFESTLKGIRVITNGVHTIKDYFKIINYENNKKVQ